MAFFVVFAMLVAYVDWRPIALSALITPLHHLILDSVLPKEVFPEQGLGRVALHAVVVFVECGVLFWIVHRMRILFFGAADALTRAESALERLRLLERAIEQANDGIFIAAKDGQDDFQFRIVYLNGSAAAAFDYEPGELLGKSTDIVPDGLASPEIIETIIALARQLHLTVTAEGVETADQERQLRNLHSSRVQGCRYARPLDADAATRYLVAWMVDQRPVSSRTPPHALAS
jgi:PAS domain-containing protein